jgi:hypothetical protein
MIKKSQLMFINTYLLILILLVVLVFMSYFNCFVESWFELQLQRIVLWNPTTKEFKIIPSNSIESRNIQSPSIIGGRLDCSFVFIDLVMIILEREWIISIGIPSIFLNCYTCWGVRGSSGETMMSMLQDHKKERRHISIQNLIHSRCET